MGKPLLDVLRDVVLDPGEQAAFTNDPSSYLAQYGYEDVAPEDLSEAFGLVADTLPPDVAQAVASTAPVATAVEADGAGVTGSPGVDDLGGDADGIFGDMTQDFDALSSGSSGLSIDDDLGDGFGTGEVSEVSDDGLGNALGDDGLGDGDEAAFGEGFDAHDAASSVVNPFVDPGFDDPAGGTAFPAEVASEVDGYESESYDDDDGLGDHLDGVELPDDPGDFLDDIGSF